MKNYYNLLLTKTISMIDEDLNEEYIRKFNLSIETIKKKRKKKLTIRELDDLKDIILKLQNIPKDENFKDYILRHLKVFLIYGNVKLIDRNNIVLTMNVDNKDVILYIEIAKDKINANLEGDNYKEENSWNLLDKDYYTKYKRLEKDILYQDKNNKICSARTTDEIHCFHDNKEVARRLITTNNNYSVDAKTESISKDEFSKDNYKEVTNYYRLDGFIVKKYKKQYQKRKFDELLGYKEYQISEDYHKGDKYLNPLGHYKKFDGEFYKPIIKGNVKVKTIYNEG